jgi:hypothetical protein
MVSRIAQSVQCLTTDWTNGVRSPTEAEDLSSNLCAQTGSGAHPASYTMGTGGSFPGGKARAGRDADNSPPLVSRLRTSRSCTFSHPKCPYTERNGTTWTLPLLHGYEWQEHKLYNPEAISYFVDIETRGFNDNAIYDLPIWNIRFRLLSWGLVTAVWTIIHPLVTWISSAQAPQ